MANNPSTNKFSRKTWSISHTAPRHIIRAIVEMVNPKIGETVLDPACGTGGFLIGAYEQIRTKNSDPKNLEERNGRKVGYGEKLNKEQWKFLTTQTFHGYDVAPEMVRLALMNLLLHGLEGAKILRKDTVAGSEDDNDLRKYTAHTLNSAKNTFKFNRVKVSVI